MLEVEKRVLLSKSKFKELKKYFDKNAEKVKEFKRFTMIGIDKEDFTTSLDYQIDLRVRTSGDKGRFTIKYGDWVNDQGREEYEIDFDSNQIVSLMNMLKLLGRHFYVISYITRYQYKSDQFDITLDEYEFMDDCLLEVELQAKTRKEADKALVKIDKFLSEMKLKEVKIDKWTNFIEEMNKIKETQINFKKINIDEWFEKWKDYIFCKV